MGPDRDFCIDDLTTFVPDKVDRTMNAGFKAEYQQVDRDSAAWRIAAEYQQVDRDSAAWRIAIAGIGDKYRLDSLRPPTLGRAP